MSMKCPKCGTLETVVCGPREYVCKKCGTMYPDEPHKRIYVIMYYSDIHKAVCLDREYNFLTDDKEIWGKVCLRDIVQVERGAWFNNGGLPLWAEQAFVGKVSHVTLWTRYYDTTH